MPSPFPGMDPYLEGYLWSDVHQRLATEIARRLMPKLRPKYVARLEIYVVEDTRPDLEVGIMYPDVEVLTASRRLVEPAPVSLVDAPPEETAELPPAPLILPLLKPVPVRIPVVEVRDVAHNRLVSSIEILSPVNKRAPGLSQYQEKRQRLQQAGVHLLEIDLLRRGKRPFIHPRLPASAYLVTLIRAGSSVAELWPLQLPDKLPTLPVPLLPPDAEVPLELGAALTAVYQEAAYELSIDYTQSPPPPDLSPEDAQWARQLVAAGRESEE